MTQVRLYLSLQCFTVDLMTICNVQEDSETYKFTLTFVLSLVAPLSVIQTVSTSLDLGPNESQQVCVDTKQLVIVEAGCLGAGYTTRPGQLGPTYSKAGDCHAADKFYPLNLYHRNLLRQLSNGQKFI